MGKCWTYPITNKIFNIKRWTSATTLGMFFICSWHDWVFEYDPMTKKAIELACFWLGWVLFGSTRFSRKRLLWIQWRTQLWRLLTRKRRRKRLATYLVFIFSVYWQRYSGHHSKPLKENAMSIKSMVYGIAIVTQEQTGNNQGKKYTLERTPLWK